METPWWKSLAQIGAGAAQGVQKASNPYGGLAQAAGNLGGAIRDKLAQRKADQALNSNVAESAGIDQALSMKPRPQAGPPPTVGASPAPYPPPDEEEPMADGRIVTKPTRAVIGDDGPEAVVPLGYRPDAKVRPGMAMGRRYYGE